MEKTNTQFMALWCLILFSNFENLRYLFPIIIFKYMVISEYPALGNINILSVYHNFIRQGNNQSCHPQPPLPRRREGWGWQRGWMVACMVKRMPFGASNAPEGERLFLFFS
jgi:hypothetical protein